MSKSSSYQDRARLRLTRTPEFYLKFVAAYPKSGLPLSQYCRKHQVGESTFHNYQRDPRWGAEKSKPNANAKNKVPRMVRVLPTAPQAESHHPFEIHLVNGTVLRLAHLDTATLSALQPLLMGVTP
jgi:hypothetical protein